MTTRPPGLISALGRTVDPDREVPVVPLLPILTRQREHPPSSETLVTTKGRERKTSRRDGRHANLPGMQSPDRPSDASAGRLERRSALRTRAVLLTDDPDR